MKTKKPGEIYSDVEDFIMDEVGNYLEMFGAKPLLGRIWGLLIISDDAISLKQITDKMQVSKPAVSTTMKMGEQAAMFRKVYQPEHPRESFYKVETDFMEMMIDPGLKKLGILSEAFKLAGKMIERFEKEGIPDEQLAGLKKRLDYLCLAFDMVLEEYHIFGDRLKIRLKGLRKDLNIK